MAEPARVSESDRYYINLGYFVERFAQVEATLHKALVHTAGMDPDIARAVLSGSKVDSDISFIRRIYAVRTQAVPIGLDRCLTQLSIVNGFRNLLLHHETITRYWVGDNETLQTGRSLSNLTKSVRDTAVFELNLTALLLEDAADDLNHISAALHAAISPKPNDHWIERSEQHAWRYRPPAPKGEDRKSQKKDQKRKRPPRSSPA